MNKVIIARSFETVNKQIAWQVKFVEDIINNILDINYELSENMDMIDEINQKDDGELLYWLTVNDEPEYLLMVDYARQVLTLMNDYFYNKGDFSSKVKSIKEVTDILNIIN